MQQDLVKVLWKAHCIASKAERLFALIAAELTEPLFPKETTHATKGSDTSNTGSEGVSPGVSGPS